jgi:fructuronate reductase
MLTPGAAGPGILHFGLGAFHRAHQAVYTEEAMARAGGDWAIVAVAPHSRTVLDALLAQDLLYSVTALSDGTSDTRVVSAFAEVLHAASDPQAVVRRLADPAIRVVTLTVTEKAYRPSATVPGMLVRGLLARARADAGPIAVVSCDNLPANGRVLGDLVVRSVELTEPAAAGWVAENVTFPSTMVDRIVPATTPQTLELARQALGVTDLAAIAAEPFSQWVVEDRFPGGRPDWAVAGATLTGDVGPYERLKLRALNGVHSAVAYLGALAGFETIAEAVVDPGLARYARRLLAEDILPTVDAPSDVDVEEYGRTVLDRFANSAIRYRTLQVAMDGSQKLPQRLLGTVADRRRAGGQPRWAALAVAAWMRFAAGVADDGRALPLDDPLAAEIRSAAGNVDALLGLRAVFPAELAADAELRGLLVEWLDALSRHGVADTLAAGLA